MKKTQQQKMNLIGFTALLILFTISATAQDTPTPNTKYLNHDVTEFIKYKNVISGSIRCFNYNCIRSPLQVEICNPTTTPLKVDLSKVEPQILTKYASQDIIRPVGSITIPKIHDSALYLYESCEREIYDANTSQYRMSTQRCQVNHTTKITTVTTQPLIGDFTFATGECYNLTIPFRPTNTQQDMNTIEWQLNLTQYPNLALHPFINTDNYTITFDNSDSTEINGTLPGYNATGFHNDTGQLLANWTGPPKQGQFENLTSHDRTTDGYETLARSTYTAGGCASQGACAYDGICNAQDDSVTWSGTNTGADWICINFTKKVTVLYAEVHEDRNDINIISANYFVTDTRPNASVNGTNGAGFPFNASQMIKQQNTTETNEAGCTADAYTPIIPARILSGYFFCANISTMEGGANARIGELEIWSANFTTNSRMRSTPISMTSNMSEFRVAANQSLNGGIIGYNISCDAGATFKSVTATDFGTNKTCATNGDKLVYEIALEADPNNKQLTPLIERLDIEFFAYNGSEETANENEARTAIEQGIQDNFPTATIHTNQQTYTRYVNGTQRYATTDKHFTNNNKRWILNYLTGTDTTIAMSNLSTSVLVWEGQSLTTTQIRQQVRDMVNMTK